MKSIEENFRILRLRIALATAVEPALVVVGAPLSGDGSTYVSCGLARAFAESGLRTLLLDAAGGESTVADELGSGAGSIPRLSLATVARSRESGRIERDVAELVDEVKSRYTVTIVDAGTIPASSSALQLAHAADGVLLAVRLGRRPMPEDHETRRLLDAPGCRLLGIVPTHARRRRPAVDAPERVPLFESIPAFSRRRANGARLKVEA